MTASCRSIENDVQDDAGACLSDGVEALHSSGLCPESMWPYSDDKVCKKRGKGMGQRFVQAPSI